MPVRSRISATACGFSVSCNPSAPSTSEDPDAELAALLPCLTTGIPLAPMMIAAVVETFTVPIRSPPVPTMSSTSEETGSGTAASRIASRKPTISSIVSPFARSPIRKPASCASVASPRITWRIAQVDSYTLRSRPARRVERTSGQLRTSAMPVILSM